MKFTYPSGSKPLDGYTIKRGIGIGGFGEVYFATSDAGKELALKRIQRNLDIELRGVTQCLNLKHINLIALYDIKYDGDGEAWVIMEFIPGESLKEIIEKHASGLPMQQVEHWFCGIAAGVAYLHDHGIVHRDLKPGNIFDDNGTVKIGDYGLSKFISCSRRSGQTESVGTFHYMAPEIGKGVYGKEIDIYALGIVLHELLTGHVPFDGETSQEIIMKHLTADPDLSRVSAPFATVLRKALAKDPARRYSSVDQMVTAFRSALAASHRVQEPVAHVAAPVRLAPIVIDDDAAEEATVERAGGDGPEMVFGPLRTHPAVATAASAAESDAGGEPIARAVRHGWRRFHASFEDTPGGAILKVVILAVVGLFVLASPVLAPIAVALGVLYLMYLGIRALTLGQRPTWRVQPKPPTRRQLFEQAQAACRAKPMRVRLGELLGSLLASATSCCALAALTLLIAQRSFTPSLDFLAFFTWLTIVTTVAVWVLLLAGKCWEGLPAETSSRRLTMILLGLAVGLFSFGLAWFLQVEMKDLVAPPHVEPLQPRSWYAADGTPMLPAFLAFFAALFALPRWWRLADPLRRHRVSLFGACVVGAWAWAIHLVLAFTWPVGVMTAVVIALATQLAAPWMDWQHSEPQRLAA